MLKSTGYIYKYSEHLRCMTVRTGWIRLFCELNKIGHFRESFKSDESSLNWLSLLSSLAADRWPESDAWRAGLSQRDSKTSQWGNPPKNFKAPLWEFHSNWSACFLYIHAHSCHNTRSHNRISFLCWGTSAAVWNGQGTFSQRCDHHNCISQLPPRRFTVIISPWSRLANSYQSVSEEKTLKHV